MHLIVISRNEYGDTMRGKVPLCTPHSTDLIDFWRQRGYATLTDIYDGDKTYHIPWHNILYMFEEGKD